MVKNYPQYDCTECASKDASNRHENRIVFNCGNSIGANIPVYGPGDHWQPETVVGMVNLDTKEMKSPSIKIDFSSIVSFKTTGTIFEIVITFQLSRACNNGPKVPLTAWTYEREVNLGIMGDQQPLDLNGLLTIEFKDPIAFTWCDCHDCSGCCTYFVELVDVATESIDYAVVGNVGINALAIGN